MNFYPENTRKSLDSFLKSIHPLSRITKSRLNELRGKNFSPALVDPVFSVNVLKSTTDMPSTPTCVRRPVLGHFKVMKRLSPFLKNQNIMTLKGNSLKVNSLNTRARSNTPDLTLKKSNHLVTRLPLVKWFN
jgi:hypothetical protein